MPTFAAVIFDMDGLLIDSERIALDTFSIACEEFGLGNQKSLFMAGIGRNGPTHDQLLKDGFGTHIDFPAFKKAWKDRYHEFMNHKPIPVKRGALDLLQHLTTLGIPRAVATSTERNLALIKLERTALKPFFDVIICGDDVTHSKPNPLIYQTAAQALNVKSADCLALEDSTNGVKSAHAAGMTVVQIPDLIPFMPELIALKPTVLTDLYEVKIRFFEEPKGSAS